MTLLWGLTVLSLASQDTARIRAIQAIEDARPPALSALAPLVVAATSTDTLVARWAVRGLGRQQRADLIPAIGAALASAAPGVRREAANALGQSAQREGAAMARNLLERQLEVEPDPSVRGAILRTIGRLPTTTPAERDHVERILSQAIAANAEGAAHGLASLYRRTAARQAPSTDAVIRLATVATTGQPMASRIAMAAYVGSGRTDTATLLAALTSREREVRRLAGLASFAQADLPGRERVIDAAWKDAEPAVRYEAVRAYARHLAQRESCEPIMAALDDADLHIRLLATDLLAGCGPMIAWKLESLAQAPLTDAGWHLPAHAVVSLARVDSVKAAALVPRFAASPVWWARMYGARAAETAGLTRALMALARDPHPNVREAALSGLHRRAGHAADSLYLAALDSPDYQLLQTAAQALDSSPDPRAAPALLAALARVTAERRETSRDPRMAMLTSLERVGSATHATTLREYVADFDTTVAAKAAQLVSRWSGVTVEPAPTPLARQPVPSWSDLAGWSRLAAVITMRGGGVVRVRLRPFDAPTNVWRFIRMVRSGWFDDLTWHRVAPNFVVQGGSPGANEYMGDGPFTRDELGLEHHTRGTVGISTRGRDTGDGQLFFNLIDNWRLDHDYTIIGEVIEGMDLVDAWQEGAVIERVELREIP